MKSFLKIDNLFKFRFFASRPDFLPRRQLLDRFIGRFAWGRSGRRWLPSSCACLDNFKQHTPREPLVS